MARYLPEHESFFNELINDEGSDGEFEGFDLQEEGLVDDNGEAIDPQPADFMANWTDGDREPAQLGFTGSPGLKVPLQTDPTPLEIFSLFINEDDFKGMAVETNRYADQHIEAKGHTFKPKSRWHKWASTTTSEMRVFIAMIVAMGLVVQLDVSEYWSTCEIVSTPFFPKCMPRDRFWLLTSSFHLVNNLNYVRRGNRGFDPLFKLGSLYKNLVYRFNAVYQPHRQLSLDEGMVPWRGNLAFRVYNPDKPKKYGIKAYMICDATNGYCTRFRLYTGRSEVPVSEFGATYDLVMDMLRGYFGQGYIIYMDNYYSSPKLYTDLWVVGVGASGTLRANRKGVPQRIKDRTVEKGSTFTMHNDNLMLTKFHDRKVVHLLSTTDKAVKVPSGKNNPATGQPIMKPEVVVNYDKYMGGVDRSDQMVSYATFQARTLKWWKRVIFHVMSLAILNAYLIYKEKTTDRVPMLHRQFRKKLVKELVSSVNSEDVPGMCGRGRGRPSTASEPIFRLQGRHFPKKLKATGKKKNVTRTCVVCGPAERDRLTRAGEKRKRYGHESSYQCDSCDVALCVDPCFRLYHTQKDFCSAYLANKENEEADESS